jgi:hypothetical protein
MQERLRAGCFCVAAARDPNQPDTDANDTPAAAIRKQSRRDTMRHLNRSFHNGAPAVRTCGASPLLGLSVES